MFDYSRAACRKIKKDIDGISFALNIVTQTLSLAYLAYILFFGSGLFPVKLTLFVLSAAYFAFFLIASAASLKKGLKRRVKLIFQWSRRLIKIFNLGVIIYGFANAEHTSFSLLLIAFTILSWGLDLIIGIISFILTSWLQLFFIGVETDMDEFKKSVTAPFTATGNFFKRMVGKDVVEEETPPPTSKHKLLGEMVEKERAKRASDKLQAVFERKQKRLDEKLEKKQAKKDEKLAKKQAKKQGKRADALDEEIAPDQN